MVCTDEFINTAATSHLLRDKRVSDLDAFAKLTDFNSRD